MSKRFLAAFVSLTLLVGISTPVNAAGYSCENDGLFITPSAQIVNRNDPVTINVQLDSKAQNQFDLSHPYYIYFQGPTPLNSKQVTYDPTKISDFTKPTSLTLTSGLSELGTYTLEVSYSGFSSGYSCTVTPTFEVREAIFNQTNCTLTIPANVKKDSNTTATVNIGAGFDPTKATYSLIYLQGQHSIDEFSLSSNANYLGIGSIVGGVVQPVTTQTQQLTLPSQVTSGTLGPYTGVVVVRDNQSHRTWGCAVSPFTVGNLDTSTGTNGSAPAPGAGAKQTKDTNKDKPQGVGAGGLKCIEAKDGISTAIGCIPSDPAELVAAVLKFATGAGGGIALLLMISGAFKMITSAGNPDAVKKGQEQFTSAIIGLLFIIFSVLLLQIIGVDILGLPGFLTK